jgi:mannose-6-phosphate isomerase-like protein (cupin superfamily)
MTESDESGRFGRLESTFNLETILDGRGGIFTWLPKEDIKEFNLLYFKPGESRGDHYHPEFTEYFLVVDGSGVMVYTDPNGPKGNEERYHISRGDCMYTKPGIAHAVHAINDLIAVAMLTKPWDKCDKPIIHCDVSRHREKKEK